MKQLFKNLRHYNTYTNPIRTVLGMKPSALSFEELSQNASRIPSQQFDLKSLLRSDMQFLQSQYSIQTLRELQKDFAANPYDYESCIRYVRQLNREGKHAEALNISNQILFQLKEGWTKDQHNKIYEQQQIAMNCVGNKNNYKANPSFLKSPMGLITLVLLFSLTDLWEKGRQIMFENDNTKKPEIQQQNTDKEEPGQQKKGLDRFLNMFGGKGGVQEEKNIPTRFKDVLGIDEFKEELEEIVDYLKNPLKYTECGAKLPKGLLLVGPPGTGKTLLARALAGEANCAFFYKSGSEFDEMFVGVGASRVRELFQKARQKAPSIIFIDEIDTVGGTRRVQDPSSSRDTINQILTEMDGFKQSESVIVIGATNFEKVLDPALKRPGRFDKIIHVPLPDVKGRESIFSYYLEKIKFNQEKVQPHYLARQTSGFSGADIQNMVNVAILNAIRNERQIAEVEDFEFAIDRISMGIGRKSMFVSEKEKLCTAYHEGGHALTSVLTDGAIPLHKVTILPRGGALGFTSMIPEKDQLNYTKKGILASIDVALGGRAAEDIFLGQDDITSGCSNDLAKATEMAYMYVKQLGMDDKVSLISIQSNQLKTSDQFDYMCDMEVKKILDDSYLRVKTLLQKNKPLLEKLAVELVKKETLTAEEVKQLAKNTHL